MHWGPTRLCFVSTFIFYLHQREQVSRLQEWCTASHLIINMDKTQELILHSSDRLPSLVLCDPPIETVHCFKYLRTYINNQLTFEPNADWVSKKANQTVFSQEAEEL